MPNKPIGQVEIDWGHPLAEGLRGCYLFNDTYDLVSHEKVTLRGDSILDGTGNLVVDSSLSFPINDGAYTSTKSVHNGELSVVADITLRSSGLNQQIYSADSNDSNKREWQFRISGTNNVQFIPFVNNSNDPATGSTALTVGNRYTVGCTHNKTLSTNNVVVYLNGMQDGVDTKPGSLDDDGALKCIGIRTKTITPTIFTEAASHKFNYIYHWDRALSAEEIQSLHQDPYQFLKPVKTVQEQAYAALFSVAAGSGVNVDIGKTDLILNSYAPSILATENIDINISRADLILNSYAPTALVSNHINIDISKTDLSLNSYAPSVNAGDNVDIAINKTDLNLSSHIPTVLVSDHINIAINKTDLTLNGYALTVQTTNNINIAIGKTDLVLNNYAPVLSISDHVNISIGKTDLTLNSYIPLVSNGDLIVIAGSYIYTTPAEYKTYATLAENRNYTAAAENKTLEI